MYMFLCIYAVLVCIILLSIILGYMVYDNKEQRRRLESETIDMAWKIHRLRVSQMENSQESRSVILVEGRCHHLLKLTVLNLRERLPSWKLHVVHCKDNADFVQRIVTEIGGYIQLTMLSQSNLKITEFSRLIGSQHFWENVADTDRVLMTQTDAWLCHDSFHQIEEYFVYDYVGAPWIQWRENDPSSKEMDMVGNCGLCLCKRIVMLETVRTYPYSKFVEENHSQAVDVYFGRYIINTAPALIAKSFSVENIWYDRPLGVHKPYNMNTRRLRQLEPHCKGIMNLSNY